MTYLQLFWGFFRVGCFSFGGAYSAIPIIRDIVVRYGWLSDEALSYMIAVSESTPGPIMVNLATYVGSSQAGVFGSAVATFAVVLPPLVIMLLVMKVMKAFIENKCFKAVLKGLNSCVAGVILATGVYMSISSILFSEKEFEIDFKAFAITLIVILTMLASGTLVKKKISPVTVIVISAFLGILFYGY